jgi:predicted enzyme related to lactoylglutathione lyase
MHAVNWFELATTDIERAVSFYEKVLAVELKREVFMGVPHAVFPGERHEVVGALVKSTTNVPSVSGTVVYLATRDLDGVLGRVVAAGGKVVAPKMSIGPMGFVATIDDTEGNRVGLHMEA